jgi:hypothetical protein
MKFYSGGYLVTEPRNRPVYLSEYVPEVLFSPSSCLCKILPLLDNYLDLSDAREIDEMIDIYDFDQATIDRFVSWINDAWATKSLRMDGFFNDLDTAREFTAIFL